MITLSSLTELLGWATVINMGILVLAAIALVFMRGFVTSIHSKMMGVNEQDLAKAYFNYLANYKVMIFVFALAPYVALKIMGH